MKHVTDASVRVAAVYLIFFLSSLCVAVAAEHQRIAVVKARSLAPYDQAIEGIQEGLASLGRKVDISLYDLGGDVTKGSEIAELIEKSEVKLVFAVGTEAVQAMKGHIGHKPLILAMVFDPLEEKFVSENDLNIYGANLRVPFELRFVVIKKVLPAFNRFALIHRKETKNQIISEASSAAAQMGFQLTLINIDNMSGFSAALEKASQNSQALLMILDQEMYNKSTVKELLLFSARKRYPVIALSSNYVKAGALLSVSTGFKDNGVIAGKLGARLLNGEAVSPRFVSPEKTQLAWNRHVAELLGVSSSVAEKEAYEKY